MSFSLFDCLSNVAEKILGSFTDPSDRLFKLQYIQYEWIRVVMEQARREGDFCSGIIFWMMNDCWPAASGWSLIDYYNLPKNAFYSFKRCAKPLIASIDYENGSYLVYIVNDGEKQSVTASLKILSKDRKTVKELTKNQISVESASSCKIFELDNVSEDGEVLICDIVGEFGTDRAFYCHGSPFICPADIEWEEDKEKHLIKVCAKEKYVHAVTFTGSCVFDDNCFSLLPFESREISYRPFEKNCDEDVLVQGYTLV